MNHLKYKVLLVAISLTLLSGCGPRPFKHPPDPYFKQNIRIVSKGANPTAVISANLHLPPEKRKGQHYYPAIIFANSWGFDEYEYEKQAEKFSRHGYVVLSYSARGWGNSTGWVDVGGAADVQDIHAIISWLITHEPVDPQRIAMGGVSYGAGLALLGASQDERVHAVIAMSGWSNLLHSLYFNQTPAVMNIAILKKGAALRHARLNPTIQSYLTQFSQYQMNHQLSEWGWVRSPEKYIANLNQRNVPVYLNNNLGDKLFLTADMLSFYQHLTVSRKRLDLSQGVHTSAEASGLRGVPNVIWQRALAWLDDKLQNGIYVQVNNTNTYRKLENISMQKKYFYLIPANNFRTPGKLITDVPQAQLSTTFLRQGNSRLSTGTSEFVLLELNKMRQAIKSGHAPSVMLDINKVRKSYGSLYITNALNNAMFIFGMPRVNLWVGVNSEIANDISPVMGQVIAYLYDLDPKSNNATLITYGPTTIYSTEIHDNSEIAMTISMRLAAYVVPAGHRLLLGLGTLDPLYTKNINWRQNTVIIDYQKNQQHAQLALDVIK